MAIARPSRPSMLVVGTVAGIREIKRTNSGEVLGAEFTIETRGGDRLGVTGWSSDHPDLNLGAGEVVALVVYPAQGRNGDTLTISRRVTPDDVDQLISAAGLATAKS